MTPQIQCSVGIAVSMQDSWKHTALETRIEILKRYIALIADDAQTWRDLISEETGKAQWDAQLEVNAALAKLDISIQSFMDHCKAVDPELQEQDGMSINYHPLGSIAILSPFNFPLHLCNGHLLPALLAGNTAVIKPSEYTPKIGQKIMDTLNRAGLPKGVVTLVQGDAETSKTLISDPRIAAVCFTGSSQTGQKIKVQLAGTHTIPILEMGGNNPYIVSEISDIRTAVYLSIVSAFISSGQRCTCARRLLLIRGKTPNSYLEQLQEAIQTIRVGGPNDPDIFMGPLIHRQSADEVLRQEAALIDLGASPIIPLQRLDDDALLSPGLIDCTSLDSPFDEEIFGPLLQVYWVDSFDEAIQMANDTQYGLSAGLLSDSKDEFLRAKAELNAGIVNWNQPSTGASSRAPFGGIKASGNLRATAFDAAKYCSYPMVSQYKSSLEYPDTPLGGLQI